MHPWSAEWLQDLRNWYLDRINKKVPSKMTTCVQLRGLSKRQQQGVRLKNSAIIPVRGNQGTYETMEFVKYINVNTTGQNNEMKTRSIST